MYAGYWEGGEDYYTYWNCDGHHSRSIDKKVGVDRPDWRTWCGYDLRDNDKPVTDMNGTYSTHLYTHKSIEVIKRAANSSKVLLPSV